MDLATELNLLKNDLERAVALNADDNTKIRASILGCAIHTRLYKCIDELKARDPASPGYTVSRDCIDVLMRRLLQDVFVVEVS